MAQPIAIRYVAPVEAGGLHVPGTLVMTDQELARYTSPQYRAIGAYAETGRVEHWVDPERVSVNWNFANGSIDAEHLRTVAVVPEGTPGSFPAWINGLPRYEVTGTIYNNFDVPCGHPIVGFDDEIPEDAYDDTDREYRDRWALQLAMSDTCPHFCERRVLGWRGEEGPCDCHTPSRTIWDEPPF